MTISSPFLEARAGYKPRFPASLSQLAGIGATTAGEAESVAPPDQQAALKDLFPLTWGRPLLKLENKGGDAPQETLKMGVVLSGGQAPGGHNVICGLFDALKSLSPENRLIGFRRGPSGILDGDCYEITADIACNYINTGGFDMLGSGRTKIETPEQFAQCQKVLTEQGVNVLVIIGGDDSNTNAALLAEHFEKEGSKIRVIGVPKTIDGDLKNAYVETSFGFDTATRLYAELISNLCRDTLSAKKYYHFVRLMGRSASHITLEAAFQTQPNIVLIGEEVAARKMTLREVVDALANVIIARAEEGKNYGVVLVPEGLIEFIPEVRELIEELNSLIAKHKSYIDSLEGFTGKSEYINSRLSRDASYTFSSMPIDIQRQLLMDRDPHGNVQVSQIETEKLLIEMLAVTLGEAKAEGRYKGKFATQRHFLGYEGRCTAPTNFDADYAYSLGRTAAALAATGANGYMAVVRHLAQPREKWEALGVPLTAMLNLETRNGKQKPVIRKGLVDLSGKAYKALLEKRDTWARQDVYRFSGAIQYFGPPHLVDRVPYSIAVEQGVEASVAW